MVSTRFSRRAIARTIAAKLVAEPSRQEHWVKVLAAYLVEHKRAGEAGLIVDDILHELHRQHAQLLARVTTAQPLSDSLRASLTQLLARQTSARTVTLVEAVDPTLVGGLVARTPDAELDASVRTTLNRLATIN